MSNRIKIKETSKQRAVRLADDKELNRCRTMLNDDKLDVRGICRIMNEKSNEMRKRSVVTSVFSLVTPLLKERHHDESMSVGKLRKGTPMPSALLSSIAKDINDVDIYMNTKHKNVHKIERAKIIKEVFPNHFVNTVKKLKDFDATLMAMFNEIESLIIGVMLMYNETDTFSNNIYNANSCNVITRREYNVLKIFNQLRNLMAHNSSISVITTEMIHDNVLFYKSIILETRDVITDIGKRHLERLTLYIIATEIIEEDVLSEESIGIFFGNIDAIMKNEVGDKECNDIFESDLIREVIDVIKSKEED